jgi:hypothetical protein
MITKLGCSPCNGMSFELRESKTNRLGWGSGGDRPKPWEATRAWAYGSGVFGEPSGRPGRRTVPYRLRTMIVCWSLCAHLRPGAMRAGHLSRHRADLRPCSAVSPPGHRAVHPGQRQPPTVLVGLHLHHLPRPLRPRLTRRPDPLANRTRPSTAPLTHTQTSKTDYTELLWTSTRAAGLLRSQWRSGPCALTDFSSRARVSLGAVSAEIRVVDERGGRGSG